MLTVCTGVQIAFLPSRRNSVVVLLSRDLLPPRGSPADTLVTQALSATPSTRTESIFTMPPQRSSETPFIPVELYRFLNGVLTRPLMLIPARRMKTHRRPPACLHRTCARTTAGLLERARCRRS